MVKQGAGKFKMGTALSNPQYLKYTTDKQIWIGTAYGREDTRMGPSLKGLEGVRQLRKRRYYGHCYLYSFYKSKI